MQAESVLKAMADGTRRRTLSVLSLSELGVSELVEVLRQPQSTVSRHLRVLREAGLIRDRREGNTVLYSVVVPEGSGNGSDLTTTLLGWLEGIPLAEPVDRRLRAVIRRRQEMSHRFFDRVGRKWDGLREENFGASFHLEAFLSLLPRDWVVADVGSGTGYLLSPLARQFRKVIAVEPVKNMLETARRRVADDGLSNVELCQGDLANLPIGDGSVDLGVAVLVLHHVAEPAGALAELYRIVRPGGRVLIVEQTAHDHDGFRERMQDRWYGFDPAEFGGLVRVAGFCAVRSDALTSVQRSADAPDLFVTTGSKV